MARYLDPKNDVVFKKIFGRNPHLLISFLNSQLTFEDGSIIESIEYLKDELIPDNPLKRRSIVDVHCTDNLKRQFIVEMQVEWVEAFFERMLFNTAHIYSRQLKRGSKFLKLQPVYGLAILNDTFDRETDEYYHSFEMMNPRNPKEKISGMNIVIIEIEKFVPKTRDEKELAVLWLRFLKEIDEDTREAPQELKENSLIGEALELCEEAAYTDAERYEYDRYWDAIRREAILIEGKEKIKLEEGIEIGKEQGIEIGKEQGIEIGEAKGEAKKETEFVLNLYKKGLTIELIADYAGLSTDKVKEILNQNGIEI
jgi:predicted transposase/invertase (TIGR01784 family)